MDCHIASVKEALIQEVKAGNLYYVVKILDNVTYADIVNGVDKFGRGSLHWAAFYGYIDILERLLSRTVIEINAKDHAGSTALHLAVSSISNHCSKLKVIKMLLEYGVQLDITDKNEATPLTYTQSDEVARLLIEYGANTDFYAFNTHPKIHLRDKFAHVIKCIETQPDVLQTLQIDASDTFVVRQDFDSLQRINDFSFKKPESPSQWEKIVQSSDIGLAVAITSINPLLVDEFFKVSAEWYTPLSLSCVENNQPMMELLVELNATVDVMDADNNTILMRIIQKQEVLNLETISFLISCKSNLNHLNDYGESPLTLAVHRNNADLVKLLVEGGAICKEHQLFLSVQYGNVDIIQYLLRNGNLSINAENEQNFSALDLATKLNKTMVCQVLLENGITPSLRLLITKQEEELIRVLLSFNCSFKISSEVVNTIEASKIELVLMSCDNADFVFDKYVALEHVVSHNRTDLVELFIKYGACCNLQILLTAIQNNLTECISVILQNGNFAKFEIINALKSTENRQIQSILGYYIYTAFTNTENLVQPEIMEWVNSKIFPEVFEKKVQIISDVPATDALERDNSNDMEQLQQITDRILSEMNNSASTPVKSLVDVIEAKELYDRDLLQEITDRIFEMNHANEAAESTVLYEIESEQEVVEVEINDTASDASTSSWSDVGNVSDTE